jgi:hypothetical protein
MDYKKELLHYLYDNNSKSIEIHQIFEDGILTQGEIRTLIKDLKSDGIIETHSDFRMIGTGSKDNPNTIKSLHIKARITPFGEAYVRDTYLKKNDTHQINAHQLIYAGGDINAPISLANDHSDSNASQSIAIDRKKRATAIQIIKYASLILSPIAAAIAIYQFFLK